MVCMSHEGYNLNARFLGLAYAALLFGFDFLIPEVA